MFRQVCASTEYHGQDAMLNIRFLLCNSQCLSALNWARSKVGNMGLQFWQNRLLTPGLSRLGSDQYTRLALLKGKQIRPQS